MSLFILLIDCLDKSIFNTDKKNKYGNNVRLYILKDVYKSELFSINEVNTAIENKINHVMPVVLYDLSSLDDLKIRNKKKSIIIKDSTSKL